jgi:hypothetical protein
MTTGQLWENYKMITLRLRQLMTQGFGISNKFYFDELEDGEFDAWVSECRCLLSRCKPQPQGFPWCPDHHQIQEIVFLLLETNNKILSGKIEYMGIL